MANHETDQYAEVFELGHSGTEHSVHQRIRANSSIMQLKKILGTCSSASGPRPTPGFETPATLIPDGQWLTIRGVGEAVANRGEIRKYCAASLFGSFVDFQ